MTSTLPEAGAVHAPASGSSDRRLPATVDVAIVGGGCSGLATAVRLAGMTGSRSVLVVEGRSGDDGRSWCSWDDGSDPVPEARSASWSRWEVRTERGVSVGSDPAHPYVLVRAADRRAAADRRLATSRSVRLVDGVPVRAVDRSDDGVLVRTRTGSVRASAVLDARGPRCPTSTPLGRVVLHQRFVGQWVTAERPVFDPTTVTLMDFADARQPGVVHFVYVLPVSTTHALVESTLFTPVADDPLDHRSAIAAYVQRRWALDRDEWKVDDEEQGCIPMTDVVPAAARPARVSAVLGTTRPSSGYGFARSNRHSAVIAEALAAGTPVPAFVDRGRTRFLDAVFLRFLRHRPDEAAEAFRRLFALPGPLVVRFLTERSSVADDLRIVLALQKTPFLAALVRTLADAAVRAVRGQRGRS